MGKLFDKYIDILETPVLKYLNDRYFYESTMSPRFMDAASYGLIANLKALCLRKDIALENERTLRIFINDFDIYYEIQTGYGSLEASGRFDPNEDVTSLSDLLDEILSIAIV